MAPEIVSNPWSELGSPPRPGAPGEAAAMISLALNYASAFLFADIITSFWLASFIPWLGVKVFSSSVTLLRGWDSSCCCLDIVMTLSELKSTVPWLIWPCDPTMFGSFCLLSCCCWTDAFDVLLFWYSYSKAMENKVNIRSFYSNCDL